MAQPIPLDDASERRFWRGVESAQRFFMGVSEVYKALDKLARTLDELEVPYAIIGAMALNEFGYQRTTVDVDVLLTAEGLATFKAHAPGRGYTEKSAGSRGVRDTEHGVDIDIVLAGSYPGNGKPKPVIFPDPAAAAERGTRVALLPLHSLIELKLASGMTAAHRLKDLADVQEVIRAQRLTREFADALNPYVRGNYLEPWQADQDRPAE